MAKDIDAKIDELATMMAQGFSELRKDTTDGHSESHSEITNIRGEMRSGFAEVRSDIQELSGRMNAVERRLGSVEESLDEVKEILSGVAKAVDKDAETLIGHDRRITKLETQSI